MIQGYLELEIEGLAQYAKSSPTDKRNLGLVLKSYAKINLFLDVLGKMESGYHEIVTLFSEINLYDSIKFCLTNYPALKLLSSNNSLVNRENLIYQIGVYIQAKYSVRYGAKITLEKNIPIAAGLGGGSSDAATTILGLNWLWKLDMTTAEMNEVAARFGSDISFFLVGGQAIGTGRGEKITPLSNSQFIDIDNILLVNPNFHISANEAYSLLGMRSFELGAHDVEVIPSPAKLTPPLSPLREVGKMEKLLETKDTQFCYNKLQDGICKAYPVISETLGVLSEYGAKKAILSGSGPTMIGFFDDISTLEKAQKHINTLGFWTFKTSTRRRQNQ